MTTNGNSIYNLGFMERVTYEEEEIIFSFVLDMFFIGMNILPNHEVVEPQTQFKHELGTIVVDETLALEKVKIFKIAKWTLSQDTQVQKVKMGTIEEPKYLKLNVDIKGMMIMVVVEDLL